MGLASGSAIYFVTWWLVFFLVLPIGGRTVIDDVDVERGQDAGAPKRPRLVIKMVVTTFAAAVIFAIFYAALESGAISFRSS